MPTRLAAGQIQVRYGTDVPPVLAEFSLDVCSGEFIGIIGPNGSGKSTLIRALSRALRPDRGAVLLDEADLYTGLSARGSARRIGVVPQDTQISLDFSVREIVRMGRAPHLPRNPFAGETGGDELVVQESLRAAGVEELADRIISTLSGGERQRVLLARALAQQPDILLLDEPTAHLDLRHQGELLILARELAHGQGKAVLAVLHDVNLAAAYCDQLVLLTAGHVAAQGTPTEVLTEHTLQRVYGARVWVRPHPVSGRPLVLSLPELPASVPEGTSQQVHVICGGGTGAALMIALHHAGCAVTAGALNDGDTDSDAARLLAVPWAAESSFCALSGPVLAEAARLASSCDCVLVAEVPFGPANIGGLEAALALQHSGKPVGCLHSPKSAFGSRDFTGGIAAGLWERLLAGGAVLLPDTDAAVRWVLKRSQGS